MQLKIFHVGDIQIEVTTSGKMSQRLAECRYILDKTVEDIKNESPDLVYIAGDIFQTNNPNGDEEKLFTKFIHKILPYCNGIRIIPGNHDIKQKNNAIMEDNEPRNLADSIDSLISAINSPKIEYYRHSGLYTDVKFDITWAVWSQIDKHSVSDREYNPWNIHKRAEVLTNGLIELYHDPIKGALNFDGNAVKGSEDYAVTLKTFKANTILAGDIHNPMIYRDDDKTFTYCSSLIQRHFGEGDYWRDSTKTVHGNSKHGYNIVQFDTELDKVTDIKFVPVTATVGRHTIQLSKSFNYDLIDTLEIDPLAFNEIMIKVHGNIQEFVKHQVDVTKHLKSKYDCKVNVEWDANVINDNADVDGLESTDELISTDKVIELSDKYIDHAVTITSMVSDDLKDQAKLLFKNLFRKELDKIDLSSERVNIELLKADISNFMTFGQDVHINFDNVPLTRILGSNGVGKTTIFYFVSWMFNDLISTQQTAKNKKQNYQLYFNDRIEADTVGDSIEFLVNGVYHKLEKHLTRTWKRNKPHYFEKDWMNHISGYNVTMKLTSDGLNSEDVTEITEYLNSDVLTFSDYIRTIFFNQNMLDSLIHQKSEDLNQTILRNVGLNFFDRLLATYDDLRDTMMAKVSKPVLTIDQILQHQKELDQSISDETDKKLEHLRNQTLSEELIVTIDNEVSDLSKQLKNVRPEEEIETASLDTSSALLILAESITNAEKEKTNAEQLITANKEKNQLITETVNKLKLSKSDLEADHKIIISKIEMTEALVDASKNELRMTYDAAYASLILELDSQQKDIDKKKLSAEKLTINQSKVRESFASEIKKKVDTISSDILKIDNDALVLGKEQLGITGKVSSLTYDLSVETDKLTTANHKIKGLEDDDLTCTECGRKHDEKTIVKHQESIQKIKTDAVAFKTTEDRLEVELLEQRKFESVMMQKIADMIELKTPLEKERDRLQSLTIIDDDPTSKEFNKQLVDITSEIDKTNNDITSSENLLTAKKEDCKATAKLDQSVIDVKNKTKKLIADVEQLELDKKIKLTETTDLQTTINTEDAKIIDIDKLEICIKNLSESILQDQESVAEFNRNKLILRQELLDAKSDKIVNDKIRSVKTNLDLERMSLDKTKRAIQDCDHNIFTNDDKIKTANADIESIKKYNLVDAVMKLYKRMVSKNGLAQYLFEHIIPILNKGLNRLLDGLMFRLIFDSTDLSLKMIDLTKNVTRPVTYASGAETTFLGLALVAAIRENNISKTCNFMFLDELTGKLNSGKNIPYDAPDYQGFFKQLVKRISENVNIMIVDHVVIQDYDVTKTIVVEKTDNGSVVS